jgi:hypothetical protein
VHLGKGQGVLLVTDQTAACALTKGEPLDGAVALALSFDLDEVATVQPDWKRTILRKLGRPLTVELKGASWGAVGFAVAGELVRQPGMRGAPVDAIEADTLVARLSRS